MGRPKKEFDIFSSKNEEKIDVEIKATRVFLENLTSTKKININIGGGGSSKSHSIIQLLLYKLLTEPKKKILVVRKTMPSMRTSVILPFHEVMDDFHVTNRIREDKVGMNLFFGNSFIHFNGLDNPEKIKCFHSDTDIFTKEGFKNVKDVKVGDLVATVNPQTGEAEFQPVTNFYEYDFDGNMISPASETGDRGSWTDFCVTPEHKMLTHTVEKRNWRFVEAKDLPGTYYIKQSANFNSGEIVDSFEIPRTDYGSARKNGRKDTKFPIIPWLKFLGWFLSKGTCYENSITLSQIKEDERKKLKEVLEEFSYDFMEREKYFYVSKKDLSNYLKQFGKSYEKFIPREIMNLHPSLLRHLFEALIDGNGVKINENRIIYCTNSKQLRDDISELAIKLGYCVEYNKTGTQKYNKKIKDIWAIYINKREEVKITNKKQVPYKGKVYCIEVLPYHTTLTRFNGKIAWTGQSSSWSYIWFEEATDMTLQDFNTVRLYLRAPKTDEHINQIFMSFNPIDEFHWIKERLIESDGFKNEVNVIHSTYKDNPFLNEDSVKQYEDLINQDFNFYRIYALGEWGKLENLIYRNWTTEPMMPKEKEYITLYGMDFGFNDPSVLVRCKVKDQEIHTEEMIYQRGLTNSQLIEMMKKVIPEEDKMRPIYCDSAEPQRIKEMRLAGLNVREAQKNVYDGITLLKRFNIFVQQASFNTIKEFQAYSWKTDKNSRPLDEPIEFMDHSMAALRYAIYSHFRGSGVYNIRWI